MNDTLKQPKRKPDYEHYPEMEIQRLYLLSRVRAILAKVKQIGDLKSPDSIALMRKVVVISGKIDRIIKYDSAIDECEYELEFGIDSDRDYRDIHKKVSLSNRAERFYALMKSPENNLSSPIVRRTKFFESELDKPENFDLREYRDILVELALADVIRAIPCVNDESLELNEDALRNDESIELNEDKLKYVLTSFC